MYTYYSCDNGISQAMQSPCARQPHAGDAGEVYCNLPRPIGQPVLLQSTFTTQILC
jgi:hypothetical protein